MLRVTQIVSEIYPTELMLWRMNLVKEGHDPEEVMNRAAELGQLGHECVEEKRLTDKAAEQSNIVRMSRHLSRWLKEYEPKYIEAEKEVFYTGVEGAYIGHIDLIAEIKGEMWLIDTKTHGLYKPYDEREEFKPMIAAQKTKVNLQTWLYSLTNGGKYENYKRGVLHINQYGYDFVELKTKPRKNVQAQVWELVSKYNVTF